MYIVIFYCRTPWLVVVEFFPQYMYRPPSTASSDFIYNNRRWLLYSASGDVSMVDCCIVIVYLAIVLLFCLYCWHAPTHDDCSIVHTNQFIAIISSYTLPAAVNDHPSIVIIYYLLPTIVVCVYAVCSGAPHNTIEGSRSFCEKMFDDWVSIPMVDCCIRTYAYSTHSLSTATAFSTLRCNIILVDDCCVIDEALFGDLPTSHPIFFCIIVVFVIHMARQPSYSQQSYDPTPPQH
jgi:hypothetical protein